VDCGPPMEAADSEVITFSVGEESPSPPLVGMDGGVVDEEEEDEISYKPGLSARPKVRLKGQR
jgi:hypothetical protein